MEKTIQQKNKDLVLEAFDTLFNKRDYARAETFWAPRYIQHKCTHRDRARQLRSSRITAVKPHCRRLRERRRTGGPSLGSPRG